MRNKFIAVAVALLCLIPSGIAYASYRKTQSAPVDAVNAVSLTIDDPVGNRYSMVREKEGDEADRLIEYFLGLKEHGQSISALPDSLAGEQFFKVTVAAAVKSVTYECYYSTDPSTCYFVASDGAPYRISEADAETFITTRYAACIYKQSAMPRLTLSGNTDVTADEASWLYKNYTGSFVNADLTNLVYNTVETYDIDGILNLAFDQTADFCSVKVTDASGLVLYDGMLDAIGQLTLRGIPQIYVDVTAKWYEDSTRTYYGNLTYRFSAYVREPAEFTLGTNAIYAGRFVAITASHVNDPSAIGFSTTLPNADTPVFYPAGDNMAVAFLGVDMDTPEGVYDLTFTSENTTAHVALSIIDPNNKAGIQSSYIYVDNAVIQSARSAYALMQYESTEKQLLAESSSTRYFTGAFLDGVAGDRTLLRGFGRDIYVNEGAAPLYRNNGVDYTAAWNTQVMACNNGEVVFAGSLDYTGNMIVIDHGWGIKTWYCNLGSISVSVGDQVKKGDGIGTVGTTGFTPTVGAHIAMSAGSKFVCPYDTWADSQYGKILISKIDE